jgi:hypothetical protein
MRRSLEVSGRLSYGEIVMTIRNVVFIVATLAASPVSTALAGDSTWLLCDSERLALNVFEHRGRGGDTRDTDLTLIFGGFSFVGTLANKTTGRVVLKPSYSTKLDGYHGRVTLDFSAGVVSLKGKLTLNGTRFPVETKLACRALEGRVTDDGFADAR